MKIGTVKAYIKGNAESYGRITTTGRPPDIITYISNEFKKKRTDNDDFRSSVILANHHRVFSPSLRHNV